MSFAQIRKEFGPKWWRYLVVMKPYTHKEITSNTFQRIFKEHTTDHELVWHRDRKDRTVNVIEGTGWKFQADNKIPVELRAGDTLRIKANEYHRIIKGSGNLVVEITEHTQGR